MSNWTKAKKETAAFRNYLKGLQPPASKKPYSYLITKEEIEKLLKQKGKASSLDGLRIYIGAEYVKDQMVPTIHVVACEKEEDQYNDYKVPEKEPNMADKASADSAMPLLGGKKPCPIYCSKSNILNS